MNRILIKLEDAFRAIKELQDQLTYLTSQNIDFHGRRIINAGTSIDANDYVTRKELGATSGIEDTSEQIAFLQSQIDSLVRQERILPQELFAACTALVNAPNGSYGDVTGCTVTLNRPGLYVVTAYILGIVDVTAGELRVWLDVAGTRETQKMSLALSTGTGGNLIQASIVQLWPKFVTTPVTAKLTCDKAGAGGTAVVAATHSSLHARSLGLDYSVIL